MLKRQIWLNYNGENHIYYKTSKDDLQALRQAINTLEKELGKVSGSLMGYFKHKPNSWEINII